MIYCGTFHSYLDYISDRKMMPNMWSEDIDTVILKSLRTARIQKGVILSNVIGHILVTDIGIIM